MRQASSAMQNLAHLLLRHEWNDSPDAATLSDAMERACDKLRRHLVKLMGPDGFTLLLVRSLTFAKTDFPWLTGIQVERDGSLKGLRAVVEEREPAETAAGFVAVLSHYLGLLVEFIGEALTLRLIQGIWPDVDLGGKDLGLEETT